MIDFEKVEQALGFKLYDWQKQFITGEDTLGFTERRSTRCCGKTICYILRFLLNNDKIYPFRYFTSTAVFEIKAPISPDEHFTYYRYTDWFRRKLLEINQVLNDNGIETCIKDR